MALVLPNTKCKELRGFTVEFNTWIQNHVRDIVAQELNSIVPSDVSDIVSKSNALMNGLDTRTTSGVYSEWSEIESVTIDDSLIPILCRVILHKRKSKALELETPMNKTFHHEVIEKLEGEISAIELYMKEPWFNADIATKIPTISDFLSISYVDAYLAKSEELKLEPREYDEKFHILQAPRLFYKDLYYYIKMCESRGVGLSVAYIDIDNLKSFNTKYGETRVDRDILPIFMRVLESHFNFHGHAYRYGGDEYVCLLPNTSMNMALAFFKEFQRRLNDQKFRDINEKITTSIGMFYVKSDSMLIAREIEARANKAKSFAKNNGKNCIAVYDEASGTPKICGKEAAQSC